jgi:hypothetical protein
MPRLTPAELQAARIRSGNLGGRPRKPTVDEARAEALARLVPKAIRVLEEHLESGRPDAWRSACRILDHSWGRPPEHVAPEPQWDWNEIDLDELSTAQLAARVRELRAARDAQLPARESGTTARSAIEAGAATE